MSFEKLIDSVKLIQVAAHSSPEPVMLMYLVAPTVFIFRGARRGKSTLSMKEPKILDGECSIQPLTTAILLPACWVFLVSGSGWETSLP